MTSDLTGPTRDVQVSTRPFTVYPAIDVRDGAVVRLLRGDYDKETRYTDDPEQGDAQLEQRQQLLSGTDRLNRSSNRLRESQRIALETEQIGAGTLSDLHRQRETIEHTRVTLLDSEGYTDRSIKTLRGMARR